MIARPRSAGSAPGRRNRRGFALPAVILLVALLTVLLTSGLSRARTERQLAHASDETAGALAVAQSGLQTYLGMVTALPADGDSTRINVTGGYANVVVHLVRQPADVTARRLYLVRSTGVAINPDSGAVPQAQRTIAQFAEWEPGYLLRRAALTAANGVRKQAGSGLLRISGDDYASSCSPTETPIPGLRTTAVTVMDPNPVPSYEGSPGLIQEGAGQEVSIATQTDVNWAGTLDADLVPDYTSFQNGNFGYPVQRVTGNLAISGVSVGSGLLIVSGNLDVDAFFLFNGVILVGGDMDFEDDSFAVIRGLIVSGLNQQLGMSMGLTDVGAGLLLDVQFASCYVEQALAPLRGLAPVRNAWLDAWATY